MPDARLTPARADELFQTLADAHEGLSAGQSAALNARLVLLMAAEMKDPVKLKAVCRRAAVLTSAASKSD